MTASNSGALVSRQYPSSKELQPSNDAWMGNFRGTRDHIEAIQNGFRRARVGAFPVNVRFSIPWRGDRAYVTFVLYRGYRPRCFPHLANRLRSRDPFAVSFWHQIPARILASLTPEQGEALDCALKPYRWQTHLLDWRGAVAWGDRRYGFALVSGPERRSLERRLAERAQHPLWTTANTAFLVALQLPFLLTVLGLGAVLLRPQSLSASRSRDLVYQQAIDASVSDPIAREAY
ncbi:MAG: hypothetical protein AAFY15_05430, partial [Cyanobacteria bacterium J06648_11]